MKTCEERTRFSFVVDSSSYSSLNRLRDELRNDLGPIGERWCLSMGYHPGLAGFITAVVVFDQDDAVLVKLKYGLKQVELDYSQT